MQDLYDINAPKKATTNMPVLFSRLMSVEPRYLTFYSSPNRHANPHHFGALLLSNTQ